LKYEKYLISAQRPTDPRGETQYDSRDYRAIIWSDQLSNASVYTGQGIESIGYEYLKVTVNDRQHITYAYRNCKKNLLLDITEWYDNKLVIDIQWFSPQVKGGIAFLLGCDN
jgi:hypothetical protein